MRGFSSIRAFSNNKFDYFKEQEFNNLFFDNLIKNKLDNIKDNNISLIDNKKMIIKKHIKGIIINLIVKALEKSSSLKVVANGEGIDFYKLALEIYNSLLFLGWYKNALLKKEFNNINKVFKKRVYELTRSNEIVLELEKIYLENISDEYHFKLDKVSISNLKLEKDVFHKFVEKIEIFSKKREVDFKDFDFTNLYKLYMYILLNENEDLLNYFITNLDQLCDDLVKLAKDEIYRSSSTKKGQIKINEYGTEAYKNYISKLIELYLIKINKEICNIYKNCEILNLTSEFDIVLNRLNKKYDEIMEKLFNESIFYTLDTKSMRVVRKIKEMNVAEFSQKR
jgi:hypothetical protein